MASGQHRHLVSKLSMQAQICRRSWDKRTGLIRPWCQGAKERRAIRIRARDQEESFNRGQRCGNYAAAFIRTHN